MDDISVLEELGLQEISRKTHIEIKYLKHMLNKEFNQLNRINTLGFVKILRREFNLDLTSWVQEYEEYLKNNHKEEARKEGLIIQQEKPRQKSRKWIYILFFFTLLCGAFWYLNGIKYANELKDKWLEDNSSSFTSSPIIEETKEKLDALEKEHIASQESVDQPLPTKAPVANQTQQDEDEISNNTLKEETLDKTLLEPIEENITNTIDTQEFQPNTLDNPIKQDEKNNSLEVSATQKIPNETQNIQESKEILASPKITTLTIKPYKKIWIGAINLKNKQRKTRLRKEDIELNISDPQLLVVGHGDFIFDLGNGQTLKPSTKLRSYYHIENNTINPISLKEFKKLNGGKNW